MYIKSREDLRESLITSYKSLLDLDVETVGTSERDIFVEAPIEGQLLTIWETLNYLAKLQSPLLYENDLLDEDKDNFCRNYNVGNINATYARGSLVVYSNDKPVDDIYMDSTFSVATQDESAIFAIAGYYIMRASSSDDYYNALTNRYEMSVQISAITPGVEGNVAANRITKLLQPIKGISGCINTSPTFGAEAAGTISQRMHMVKQKLRGRTLSNIQGIKSYVENYAADVTIVGTNDPLMLRNEKIGSGIDIYVRGAAIAGTIDVVSITLAGLSSISSMYDQMSIKLQKQPVSSLVLSIKTSTGVVIPMQNWHYSLVKDTALLKNSTRANDRLVLTSTGIAELGLFKPGDTYEIRYNYNSLLHTIEEALNQPVNLYDNRDYLLYEKESLRINVVARIKLYTGYTIDVVAGTFSLAFASFLETFSGEYIEFADVIGIIKNTAGVDNLDLSNTINSTSTGNIIVYTSYISTLDQATRVKTASGDIPIYDKEYPVVGDITFVDWL